MASLAAAAIVLALAAGEMLINGLATRLWGEAR